MENKVKVALFDFCGTFIPFQSGDEFIRFASEDYVSKEKLKKEEKQLAYLRKSVVLRGYQKFFKRPVSKWIIASRIKGMKEENIHEKAGEFIEKRVKPALLKETLSLLKECKEKGYYCFMVSAAYNPYLCIFIKEYGIDDVVCSMLDVKNKVMTGKIKHDCFASRKVKYAIKHLNKKFGKGNYEIEFSIGDSKTDIPILNLAKRKVVISKNTHQDWVNDSYEEIIYGN